MTNAGIATAALRSKAAQTADPARSWLLVLPLRVADEHVLVLAGRADVSTVSDLRDQILSAVATRPRAVRVELDGLEYCDLAGLGALYSAVAAAHDLGVHLTLSGMSVRLAWLHRTFPPLQPSADVADGLSGSGPAAGRASTGPDHRQQQAA